MALTRVLTDREADAIAQIAEEATYLLTRIKWLLDHNSDQAIDWAAGSTPAYIEEDADGNLVDRTYTRQNVANAIGSLDQIRKAFENEAVSQGDHLGNLNLLAKPLRRGA